jgi:hypothetical protein
MQERASSPRPAERKATIKETPGEKAQMPDGEVPAEKASASIKKYAPATQKKVKPAPTVNSRKKQKPSGIKALREENRKKKAAASRRRAARKKTGLNI